MIRTYEKVVNHDYNVEIKSHYNFFSKIQHLKTLQVKNKVNFGPMSLSEA